MQDADRGFIPHWIVHRLTANYWVLAVCATVIALPFALALLWIDRAGAAQWLVDSDLSPIATADTAKDFVGVAAGINAAFITLYFSITLIVLSLAAGNLGVRLIDRWLQRRLVRVSLAGLSFTLVATLVAMMAIDAEADLADTPLLLVAVVLLLQMVNIAMLAVSLHALGRTMFVDDSIDRIAADTAPPSRTLTAVPIPDAAHPHRLFAEREGYVEETNLDALAKAFAAGRARVLVHAAPGQFVLPGELLLSSPQAFAAKEISHAVPVGPYRSDNQGSVFRVRLLVEIAARALSPAINDFYTALTCADKLSSVMDKHAHLWVDDGQALSCTDGPEIVLIGQDFRSLFANPLSALRQAASAYPSVAIRLIENYAKLSERHGSGASSGLSLFLAAQAREMRDHAVALAEHEGDKHDIMSAYDAGLAPAS